MSRFDRKPTNAAEKPPTEPAQLDPDHIDAAIECLRGHDECSVSTLATAFEPDQDMKDPNLVKVMIDSNGRATDFSRIPPADGSGSRESR